MPDRQDIQFTSIINEHKRRTSTRKRRNEGNMESASHIPSIPVEEMVKAGRDSFESVGLIEYLNMDDKPIFVLDLQSLTISVPIYQNASLKKLHIVGLDTQTGVDTVDSQKNAVVDLQSRFLMDWALSMPEAVNLPASNHWGIRWAARTLRQRWRIVIGDMRSLKSSKRSSATDAHRQERSPSSHPPHNSLDERLAAFRLAREETISTYPSISRRETAIEEDSSIVKQDYSTFLSALSPFDITRHHPAMNVSPHIDLFLNFDWESTELGAMSSWSVELRQMCNFLMSDPRPAALYWGENKTMMYNEPYIAITGQKHPGMMGKTFAEGWQEIEGDFKQPFEKAHETGRSFGIDDARFYLERNGYVEETYCSLSIIPLQMVYDKMAFYNPVFETTRSVITDRRMEFLLRLGQYMAASREPKDFWQQLVCVLEADQGLDLPFALLYSAGWDVNETLSESSEQSHTLKNWVLEGLVRVPDYKSKIPRKFSSETTYSPIEEFFPNFLEIIKADSPTILPLEDGSFPAALANDLRTADGEDLYEAAIFLPIKSTGDTILGFLVLGVNPWKRYDADYKAFIELLSRQLNTAMAAAMLFEDELRRGRLAAEQATLDKNALSQKLATQTEEAEEVENRFRNMADLAPAGIFHIDPEGVLVYANNEYYNLTEHPRDIAYPMSWYHVLHESDHKVVDGQWAKLMNGDEVNFELRLKRPFIAEETETGEEVVGFTWIIAAAYAEQNSDGKVVGILGCITDISKIKWAEGEKEKRMLEAMEMKRQQESFIDMTSHEMRNPLSAIIQCADWISNLSAFDTGVNDVVISREVVDSYVDAAETILLCAQHQKRIIDDILTLSKLDSDLLYVTPIEVQPALLIQKSLKMFDGELQKSDVELRYHVESSYQENVVDWVKLDPSRVLQIFINLITNAIKFTQTEAKRKILVSVGASTQCPTGKVGFEYLPKSDINKDETVYNGVAGDYVYLTVEVQDTGRGLSETERKQLFKRFSQASTRTHVQYGGNGLGLFISRRLTELQGGQIGVASEAGVGSTFAFYLHACRCGPPQNFDQNEAASAIDMRLQTRLITPKAFEPMQESPGTGKEVRSGNVRGIPPQRHVLVVEDNIINQKVLSKQLRSAGCTVSVANHGGEALAFLETTRFWTGKESTGVDLSIVLMDLEMPVMDGITCVKQIRKFEEDGTIVRHVPVIAVTANARSEQIATAKESGMDSVVTKPFRIPELLPEMDRQLKEEERPIAAKRSFSAPS